MGIATGVILMFLLIIEVQGLMDLEGRHRLYLRQYATTILPALLIFAVLGFWAWRDRRVFRIAIVTMAILFVAEFVGNNVSNAYLMAQIPPGVQLFRITDELLLTSSMLGLAVAAAIVIALTALFVGLSRRRGRQTEEP